MSEWAKLRSFQGSQQNAFEELCCQLARRDPVAAGSRFTRKGTPDAGVECYWQLPDGSEQAWQAKYFLNVPGASQWQQLRDSFGTALKKHSRMTRYVVCIPLDRPDPRIPEQTSFADKWDEFVAWCGEQAKREKRTVEVEYWGNSEIFDRLSKAENRGRHQFWFDADRFTIEWFRQRLHEATANAGDRYSPELNIDLPIGRAMDGLGRTDRFWRRFTHRAVRLRNKWNEHLGAWKLAGLPEAFAAVMEEFNRLRPEPAGVLDFSKTEKVVRAANEALAAGWAEARRLGDEEEKEEAKPGVMKRSADLRRGLREVQDELEELLGFITGPDVRAANHSAVLVTGRAGAGKTHLFCDAAVHRLKEEQPSLLLLGEGIQKGEPWMQVIRNLGLTMNRDDFLGALDAAAEAMRCRLIVFMDALNEGGGLHVWKENLAGFLEAIKPYPSVAIALSVRDLYVDRTIPTQLGKEVLPRVEHNGFEEKTDEATRRFFQHFEIALPDHPILNPEFGTPLFLKLFCTALRSQQVKVVPKGLSGITSIFSFFLSSINAKLAQKLDYDPAQNAVRQAVDGLAERMGKDGTDAVLLDEARKMLASILPTTGFEQSLLQQLCSEGLLHRTMLRDWDMKQDHEIIRFAYQRLSDHMVVASFLTQSTDGQNKADVSEKSPLGRLLRSKTYWGYSSWFEALAIQLPERFGIELSDQQHQLDRQLEETAFLESLLWRGANAYLPRTKELIEERLKDDMTRQAVLHTLLLVTAQPDHPFNANYLHAKLAVMTMAERDRWWSIAMSERYNNTERVIDFIDWAWAERDRKGISDEAIELYGTTLAWFLTLSQRFLRDRATKGLVSLFEAREHVLIRLLEKFNNVNDPYVAERLYAVAHGVALRSQDDKAAGELGKKVWELVFAAGTPAPSVLLRMHASGAVEAAKARGQLEAIDRKRLYPPFKSNWSDEVPSLEELQKLFKDHSLDKKTWGLSRIYNSVTQDDFSHYVIGNAIDWSKHPFGRPVPPSTKARFALLVKRFPRLGEIEKSFDQVRALERMKDSSYSKQEAEKPGFAEYVAKAPEYRKELEEEVRTLLGGARERKHIEWVLKHLDNPWRSDGENNFGHERVRRHILQKVLELGYRAEWFSAYDDDVPMDGRLAHKSERIGKKYQWIAYHEVIARISDNFRFLKDAGRYEQTGWKEALWQKDYRNIDPSLLIQSDRLDDETEVVVKGREWWLGRTYDAWASREQDFAWLQHAGDLPPAPELVRVKDPQDRSVWLNLSSFVMDNQVERLGSMEQRKPDRREVFRFLWSYLVREKDAAKLKAWAKDKKFAGRWMPEPPEYHQFPLHEFFGGRQFERDDPWARGLFREVPFKVASTAAEYICEASTFDCSLSSTVTIHLPGKLLVDSLGLQMKGRLGRFYDASNQLIAWDPAAGTTGTHSVLFRESAMIEFLKRNRLVLFWVLNGEKNVYPDELAANRDDWLGRLEYFGPYYYEPPDINGHTNTNFIRGAGAPRETP